MADLVRCIVLLAFAVTVCQYSPTIAISLGECSEAICGPRVSKCMLIKSCNCSMTPEDIRNRNCSCCKDCIQCLGELFTDCCSCVGLCRPAKPVDPRLAMHSYVGRLEPDRDEQLLFLEFTNLDGTGKTSVWTVHSFPALEDSFFYRTRRDNRTDKIVKKLYDGINCTVIYLNECLSHKKCYTACETMGASSFRWFHTGCCECVGNDCISYGSREDKCASCNESADHPDNNSQSKNAPAKHHSANAREL